MQPLHKIASIQINTARVNIVKDVRCGESTEARLWGDLSFFSRFTRKVDISYRKYIHTIEFIVTNCAESFHTRIYRSVIPPLVNITCISLSIWLSITNTFPQNHVLISQLPCTHKNTILIVHLHSHWANNQTSNFVHEQLVVACK